MTRVYPATIAAPVDRELVIKKSRFLAHVAPVASGADADAVIAAVKRRTWDARHHCSAQVTGMLGERARSSDDGEPAGTAGVPMLEVLRRRGLTDVVAVVTRYFGGVKLGAGGLVRAYSSAVSEALDLAIPVDRRMLVERSISADHADAGRLDHALRAWAPERSAVLDAPAYDAAAAVFSVWVPEEADSELQAMLAAMSLGALRARATGERRVIEVPRR